MTSTLCCDVLFVDNAILYVANNRVADEFRSMSASCLCVGGGLQWTIQWNKSCSIAAQAPNTLALPPLFRVMFDFYGYFQWIAIIWRMKLRTCLLSPILEAYLENCLYECFPLFIFHPFIRVIVYVAFTLFCIDGYSKTFLSLSKVDPRQYLWKTDVT